MTTPKKQVLDLHIASLEIVEQVLLLEVPLTEAAPQIGPPLAQLVADHDPMSVAMAFLGHAVGLTEIAAATNDQSTTEVLDEYKELALLARTQVDMDRDDDGRPR